MPARTPASERPDSFERSLELQIERMQSRVDEAADRLLREGGELTVRTVRAVTGGNPNVVAPAFKRWRQNLAVRLEGKSQAPDLPPQVLHFVRLGYQAAQTIAEQRRLSLLSADQQVVAERDALRAALAGARGELEALRDERAALFEKNGLLMGQLKEQRTLNQQQRVDVAALRTRLDSAAGLIGVLKAKLGRGRRTAPHTRLPVAAKVRLAKAQVRKAPGRKAPASKVARGRKASARGGKAGRVSRAGKRPRRGR